MMRNKWLFIIAGCISFVCPITNSQSLPTKPPGYAIASAHPLATKAGMEILAQGGNAFDAAVAVAGVLAVVAPYHSGLGGSGFWLLHVNNTHKNVFIDAREVAPKQAHKNMYLDANGQVIPNLSLSGGLAAAIPGQPAALAYIAKHYGRLPLSKTLAPAIQLAKDGFALDKQFYQFLTMPEYLGEIKKYPSTTEILLKQERPYEIGETLIQKDLANTLSQLANKGKEGFYTGPIAQQLVDGVNASGGIWTLEDLAEYQIKIREPLVGAYHNMLIITAPPPSAGGVALLTMLNILSHFSLDNVSKVRWVHYLVESMRLAYWQRDKYLGDPDFVSIPVDILLSAENAKQLRQLIPEDKALSSKALQAQQPLRENIKKELQTSILSPALRASSPQVLREGKNEGSSLGGDAPSEREQHTTHISIIDAEGNRVAATMTVNYIFGSNLIAKGTGVLLNDGMDDFSTKVGAPNVFGIVGSEKNAIEPRKRPLSSMTPTFLELPDRLAIVGTPGGSRISTMVLIASLVFYEGYGAISMVSAMRFHHQYLPDLLQFEPDALPKPIQEGLKAMGYELKPLSRNYGDMQAITWDKERNLLFAASDPRNIGQSVVR